MTPNAPLPANPTTPSTGRPRRRARFVVAFVVGLTAAVAASGIGVAAWDASYEARVLPGVHVGSVDLSGLDRAAATRALSAAYPFDQGRIILGTPDGDVVLPYSAIGRRADVDALVDEALEAGRDGTSVERAVGEVRQALVGTTLQPRLVLDEPALEGAITTALAALERAPVDATITMRREGPVTTPSAAGRTADPAPVVAAALAAARSMDAPAEVVIPVDVAILEPARGDAAVAVAKVRAQRLLADLVIVSGKKTWSIKADKIRTWAYFQDAADGSVRPVIATVGIEGSLRAVRKGVRKVAKSATFLKARNGKIVGVVAGKDGRQLDVEATVSGIVAELESRADGDVPSPVRAVIGPYAPELTTEEAARTAPLMVKLGSWRTWFPISERNYFGANIWLPARIINGTVLKPGQRFEWWSAVGPITSARGFGPGGVIKSDHTDPTGATGGGMCSSSTTLFNAALRAGLRINARSNHKYYINRYPLGLDATVSKVGRSSQTMSFTNDTKHAIYIRGIRTRGSGGRGYVTYEIWGVPDGRKVTIGRAYVGNVRKAVTNEVVVDTLPHGVREQTEYPSNAMDVAVTRVVKDASGKVVHRDTFYTHYVLWNGLIEVGR